jgi:outer membrane receptor protein involved in Fe transport
MGGTVNIFTRSPLAGKQIKATLAAGNYGFFRANASVSEKTGKASGISLSGYFDGNSGFFENRYDGKRADRLRSAGGRLRFDAKPAQRLTVQLTASYDHSDQGAFPYGKYENGSIAQPDCDRPGKYVRSVAGGNANVEYGNGRIIFTSSTGFQHFDDNMDMDLDYSPLSYFFINQKQNETNWTQEFAIKSDMRKNYRWSFGAFGFVRNLRTDVITTMGKTGLDSIVQPVFDALPPQAPRMKVTDSELPMPGIFKTPVSGVAIFHQSTFDNLLIDGLSLTAGLRLDREMAELDYNTSMSMNLEVTLPRPGMPPVQAKEDTTLAGFESARYTELLPKVALRYELGGGRYIYFSAARGYKAGGYNIQMFADLVQNAVMKRNSGVPPVSVKDAVSYRPEYSWNYELGFKGGIADNALYAEIAVFYASVTDVQITQFVQSGQGRLLKNAGRAESAGFEAGLTAIPLKNLELSANYGYTRAVMKDYKTDEADHSGNFIPFAPQNTLSLGAGYSCGLRNRRIIDRFSVHAQYTGAGKIYWTEANDASQNFYGLLSLKAGIAMGIFRLNVWTRNTMNANYAAFYIETKTGGMAQKLAQRGAPFQFGTDLTVSF